MAERHPLQLLRVLLVGLEGIVAEMIEASIRAELNVAVTRAESRSELEAVIRESDVDVIVAALLSEDPWVTWLRLDRIGHHPLVLLVDQEAGDVAVLRGGFSPVVLSDQSPSEIAAAIAHFSADCWSPVED